MAKALSSSFLIILILLTSPALAQDEPGAASQTATSLPASPTKSAKQEILLKAKTECRPGARCPLFAKLVPLLHSRELGSQVAQLLGELGDARAVAPLASLAVYPQTPELGQAARAALRQLATRPAARLDIEVLARSDPDLDIRALSHAILREVPPEKQVSRGVLKLLGTRASDPSSSRVVYGETAFSHPANTWSWTSFNIAYWRFTYSPTDYLRISLDTVPPIGVLAFLPGVTLSKQLSDTIHLGVRLNAGVFYPYISNDNDLHAILYGGGPILTVGKPDLAFNFTCLVFGFSAGEKTTTYPSALPGQPMPSVERGWEYHHGYVVLPNVGFSARVSKRVKLNFELYAPLSGELEENLGKIWLFMYGARIFGESIYGDVSFAWPFFPDFWDVMKYMPMGVPMLSFGFRW
jgi:hypothetical protein